MAIDRARRIGLLLDEIRRKKIPINDQAIVDLIEEHFSFSRETTLNYLHTIKRELQKNGYQ